jgi:hypothetical protein
MNLRLSIGIRCDSSAKERIADWKGRLRHEVEQANQAVTDLRCTWNKDEAVFSWDIEASIFVLGAIKTLYVDRAVELVPGSLLTSIAIRELRGKQFGQGLAFDAVLRRDQVVTFIYDEVPHFVRRVMGTPLSVPQRQVETHAFLN